MAQSCEILDLSRLISLVSSRFKRASTFLSVLFQSRQDEQNENGPILRDSRLVSSRFKRASTFLCVLFQSRQDEQNENGPILRDSRLVSSNLARTCSSHLILPVLSWFKRAGTFLHVSFQNNETRMANKCSTTGPLWRYGNRKTRTRALTK